MMVRYVLSGLKRQWCDLKKGRPGHRFQDRYERNQQRQDRSVFRRWVQPVLGVILVAAGLFFCFFPGPGLPLLLPGVMLLSERSATIARTMDWTEVKARQVVSKVRH
jgi:hypothetical protein